MILELILALVIGILFGTFTGLFPGIHINLIASLLILHLDKFQFVPLTALLTFIVSMSITHVFLDFIPSIFLGAPEEDTFLSVLPGHQLLQEGRGYEAVILTLYGSITSIPIILIFSPLFIIFLPSIYEFITVAIPFILIFISIYMISRDENFLVSLLVFTLSGILGYLSFNLPVREPLTPLLTGLFGLSAIIITLRHKPTIKKQIAFSLSKIKIKKKEYLKSSFASFLSIPIGSFLPGIGSGHSTFLASEITKQNNRNFLFMNGLISASVMALSFITLYSIGRSRTGSAAAINEIIGKLEAIHLSVILITIIITSVIAFLIGICIAKYFSEIINKLNYKKLSIIILFILLIVNILITNFLGMVILITSTFLGIFTILSNSRRINLMGALILPTVIFYLF